MQITSLVKSSSVGPIPPQVITTSLLDNKDINFSLIELRSSATVISESNKKPSSYNIFPRDDKFVFTVSPKRISVPTLNNEIFTFSVYQG